MNEKKLILDAQKDLNGFHKLYENYYQKVFRYFVARTGDTENSEDLTSQTFLRALQNFPKYTYTGAPFGAWLFRIAHNALMDSFRQKTKEKTDALHEDFEIEGPENILEKTHNRILYEKIKELLKNFPEDAQEILLLKLVTDLKFSEIAKITGKSENTIKTKYFL